tara:strand:+ start:1213 stop:1431 length:219 start_codon:yes stop_codon:yes gene_type:complete
MELNAVRKAYSTTYHASTHHLGASLYKRKMLELFSQHFTCAIPLAHRELRALSVTPRDEALFHSCDAVHKAL